MDLSDHNLDEGDEEASNAISEEKDCDISIYCLKGFTLLEI